MTTAGVDADGIDAIRSDGGVVRIRTIHADDAPGIRALHARASNRSIYLRFFSSSRATAECYVEKLIRPAGERHHALAALVDGELVGVASFERIDSAAAEIALLVDDTRHHQGIGTLLLEQLVITARRAGVRTFVADVLTENSLMAEVLRHLGYVTATASDHGTDEVVFDLTPSDAVRIAAEKREYAATSARRQYEMNALRQGAADVVGAD